MQLITRSEIAALVMRMFAHSMFLALTAILLCSCGHPIPPTPAQVEGAKAVTLRMVTENEDWLEKHLLEAYLKAKAHNARWDASVSNVFGLVAGQRVRSNDDPAVRDKIGKIASTANADGCRDPYVRYLVLRYGLREPAGKEELKRALANGGLGKELSATADDLTRAAYPPDVVFEATTLAFSANWGKATDFELEQLREKALNSVLAILVDQTYPASRVQKDVATMLSLAG